MKVLLTAIILSTIRFAVANNDVEDAFDEAELTPDIVKRAPKKLLELKYGDNIVILGTELTPNETTDMPEIDYNGQHSAFYTLIMTDADAPDLPPSRDFLHWLIGNIPGDKVSKGKLLAEYRKPAPRLGTGLHRYPFLVYKQKHGAISFEEEPISREESTERMEFSIKEFTEKYNLGTPYFGNFVTAQAQPSCS